MIKRELFFLTMLVYLPFAQAEDLTTLDGTKFSNIINISIHPERVYFNFSSDEVRTNISVTNLPAEFLNMHGMVHDAVKEIAASPQTQEAVSKSDPLITAQMMALIQYGGNAEAVKQMIDKGADVNAKDSEGIHALQLATKHGNIDIVKVLIANGAEVNAGNDSGATALESAAYRDYVEILKLLVENGANVNAKERNKTTALMLAAGAGQTNATSFLLNKGADINATNLYGITVLMTAVNNAQPATVRLLLSHGAKVNAEDSMGYNALDYARTSKNAEIVQLLQHAGAKNSKDAQQQEDFQKSMQKSRESLDALSNSLKRWQP